MFQKTLVWTEVVAGDHSLRVDLDRFTHLRLYHGCRPLSVDPCYTEGIRVVPMTELADRFRQAYADVAPAFLESTIKSCRRERRDERVDAALDLRFLVKHASHYLVQGSEMMKAWAKALPDIDGTDPTVRLKSIGRPTAFVIDAPLDDVDPQDLIELQRKLDLLAEKGTAHTCDDGDVVEFTASFARGVPPGWIVRHEFIDLTTDPDDRGSCYRYASESNDKSSAF